MGKIFVNVKSYPCITYYIHKNVITVEVKAVHQVTLTCGSGRAAALRRLGVCGRLIVVVTGGVVVEEAPVAGRLAEGGPWAAGRQGASRLPGSPWTPGLPRYSRVSLCLQLKDVVLRQLPEVLGLRQRRDAAAATVIAADLRKFRKFEIVFFRG